MADMRTFDHNNAPTEADAPMPLDMSQPLTVFIVDTSRMAMEAFCKVFREIEPALDFFSVCSVADIAAPEAWLPEILAIIYARGAQHLLLGAARANACLAGKHTGCYHF